jgi:hypothetical protein
VSTAGDFNADGYDDIVIGAKGIAYVIVGRLYTSIFEDIDLAVLGLESDSTAGSSLGFKVFL